MRRWAKVLLCLGLSLASAPALLSAAAQSTDELDRRIARLVEQLGDNEYEVRERAKQSLIKSGADAFDLLYQAQNSDDVEVATQARYLVCLIRGDWTSPADPEEVRNLLKDYDQKSDAERAQAMQSITHLPPGDNLEPLCRLARFEESPLLSKQAAVAILVQDATTEKDWNRRAETIRKILGRTRGPGAEWLRTYVAAHDNPELGATRWEKLAEAELASLRQQPTQSHPRAVIELLRQQVDSLDRLQRPEEALAVVRRSVAIEPGDPRETQGLTELVEWLAKRKTWAVLEEVNTKFASTFAGDALLLYTLAEARLQQGKKDIADQLAEKALKLNAGKLEEHRDVAERLQERGLMDWSDREYRQVLATTTELTRPEILFVVLRARFQFSESLHDREKDLEAAEVLKGVVDLMEQNGNAMNFIATWGRNPESIKSRMNFFYASHYAAQKEPAKQLEYLDIAIGQDPTDVDVLIALYHLPNLEPQRRASTVKLIRQAVDECRKMIDEDPELPNTTACNQLAWLVANTEGDVDEAIRCSQRSVLLTRSSGEAKRVGGYLDTLGRCYYAKRDDVNAVRYQSEAARLEPHMQQIARQLRLFERAAAEKQTPEKNAPEKNESENKVSEK